MSLNISVVIWTVIDFCLLMLILDKLLFKPLLTKMHTRDDRIEEGEKKLIETEAEKNRILNEMKAGSDEVTAAIIKSSGEKNRIVEDESYRKIREASRKADETLSEAAAACEKQRAVYESELLKHMPEYTSVLSDVLTDSGYGKE
jgi:F-type H+-transporting ATPase subunit b